MRKRTIILSFVLAIMLLITVSSALATDKIFFEGNSTIYEYVTPPTPPFDLGYSLNELNSSDGLIYINFTMKTGDASCGGGTDCPAYSYPDTTTSDAGLGLRILRFNNVAAWYDGTNIKHFPLKNVTQTYSSFLYWKLGFDYVNQNVSAWVSTSPNFNGSIGSSDYVGNASFQTTTNNFRYIYVWNAGTANGFTDLVVYTKNESSPSVSNFSITAEDTFNNASINNFSAEIGGENYTTTTGTVTTNILQNDTNLYNITVFNAYNNKGAFFNKTYTDFNVSANLDTSLIQSIIRLQGYSIITNDSIPGSIVYNDTNIGSTGQSFNWSAGSYNLTFTNSSWYDKTQEFTINPLDNVTLNFTGIYDFVLNLTVHDIVNNQNLTNFSGNITNIADSYTSEYNTTKGYEEVPLLKGLNYTSILYSILGYASNTGHEMNITKTESNTSYLAKSFQLYTNNSINFTITDAEILSKITEPANVTLEGNTATYIFTINNGTGYEDNLNDDTYKVTTSATGYADNVKYITVSNSSTQNLNIYLYTGLTDITFTVKDNQGQPIGNSSITISTISNGTSINVAQEYTDFSGTAVIPLMPTTKYTITVTNPEYATFIGDVTPTQTGYTINMNNKLASRFTSIFDHITYATTANVTNNTYASLKFNIHSYLSDLQYFGFNSSYDGINYIQNISGSPAGSEIYLNMTNLNISVSPMINVDYFFQTSNGNFYTWTQTWYLNSQEAHNTSIAGGLFNLSHDLSSAWQIILGAIIVAISFLLGMLLTRNPTVSSITGIIGLWITAYAGLWPLSITIVAIILLVLLIIGDQIGG